MPERQSLRLKIPSERLALLQQSMDGVKKKRKQRVNWKPGEKEAMLALRNKYPKMPLKDFQETYYPDRNVKVLGALICQMRKGARKEEDIEAGSEDLRRSSSPRLPKLKRSRKSGPFEYSDSDDEDSSSDERIEDINVSGLRTPNKFIKLSHSTEAQSPPPNRYEKQRDPRIRLRSQTDETPQIPKETITLTHRPQTTPPETTTVAAQDSGYLEPSSSSTGMSPIVLDVSLEQPAECHGTEMQVDVIQDDPRQQTQPQALKQEEEFPEYYLRREAAKDSADMFAKVQSQLRRQEELFSRIDQLRAEKSILQEAYERMKQDYDLTKTENDKLKVEREVEIAQLKEQWQAEKDGLKRENAQWNKRFEVVKSAFDGKFEA